jgi:hypothetical protein
MLLNVGCTSEQDRPEVLNSFLAMADEHPPLMPERETVVGRTASFSTFSDAQFDEAMFETQLTVGRMPMLSLSAEDMTSGWWDMAIHWRMGFGKIPS